MHPLSERYSDLLGDGTDPTLIRLIEDLDRVCAPGSLPAQRDSAIARTIEKRIAMQLTTTNMPGRVPVTSTPRAARGKTWLTLGWAALLPTLLLLAVVVVLRNRQPNAAPQMGTVPKVFQVAAGTPLSGVAGKSGTWTVTGSMHQPRSVQVAALLADGRVLVAGGCGACTTNRNQTSAEIYDPRTGKWTMTGSMHDPRSEFTMTLLPSGQVLALGGCSKADCSTILASAELYNPQTGKWTMTSIMDDYRALHTATLLPNGQVLVTGGATSEGNTADAEIYNPQTGKWNPISPMHDARARHTATLLANGQVLVVGGATTGDNYDNGNPTADAELYDPHTGKWTITGSMHTARSGFTAVRLPSGEVLVAGGWDVAAKTQLTLAEVFKTALLSAEIYNPHTGKWTMSGSLHHSHSYQLQTTEGAVLLHTGQVLATGGNAKVTNAELYDPQTGKWTITGSMHTARGAQTTTLLANGNVLVAGGEPTLAGAEIYHP